MILLLPITGGIYIALDGSGDCELPLLQQVIVAGQIYF
jgi:hypothetical protein